MKLIKRHLNPATVISCIALFVALSGAAYAAKTIVKTQNLVNGAVTTPKLRNGAVTTGKLRNGAVIGKKIASATIGSGQLANGSVRSGQLGGQVVTEAKIKNGAVTTNKLSSESVTTGKLGNESVTAAKLSAGFYGQLIKNVSYVNAESEISDVGAKAVTALCPAGKEAIGGGARVNGELEEVAVTGSSPYVAEDGKRTGWSAFGRELPDEPGVKNWSVEAFAICAEL